MSKHTDQAINEIRAAAMLFQAGGISAADFDAITGGTIQRLKAAILPPAPPDESERQARQSDKAAKLRQLEKELEKQAKQQRAAAWQGTKGWLGMDFGNKDDHGAIAFLFATPDEPDAPVGTSIDTSIEINGETQAWDAITVAIKYPYDGKLQSVDVVARHFHRDCGKAEDSGPFRARVLKAIGAEFGQTIERKVMDSIREASEHQERMQAGRAGTGSSEHPYVHPAEPGWHQVLHSEADVLPPGMLVSDHVLYMLRSGQTYETHSPSGLRWRHVGASDDIVMWRNLSAEARAKAKG